MRAIFSKDLLIFFVKSKPLIDFVKGIFFCTGLEKKNKAAKEKLKQVEGLEVTDKLVKNCQFIINRENQVKKNAEFMELVTAVQNDLPKIIEIFERILVDLKILVEEDVRDN